MGGSIVVDKENQKYLFKYNKEGKAPTYSDENKLYYQKFDEHCIRNPRPNFNINIKPLILNTINIPFLFIKNPNTNKDFEVNFQNLLNNSKTFNTKLIDKYYSNKN